MRLTTRGRYAARLMLDLALNHSNRDFVLLKDISRRQAISGKYLGHLISSLKQAGLVVAARGAHGGYRLAKAPREIKLSDIVLAVEGDLTMAECVKDPSVCTMSSTCVTREIWASMGAEITEHLASITLEDMVRRYRGKLAAQALMWNI